MDDSVRADAELSILRSLLSRARDMPEANATSGDLKTHLDVLSDHVWSDEEHRVVYECLRTAQRLHVSPLRQEMASLATRLGHPDVDWDSYLSQPAENVDPDDLIDRLKRNRL